MDLVDFIDLGDFIDLVNLIDSIHLADPIDSADLADSMSPALPNLTDSPRSSEFGIWLFLLCRPGIDGV